MVRVPGPYKESVSAQALPIKILLPQKINKESVSAHRKYCCPEKQTRTRGVSHCGLAIYIKKYPNAKK
jgi:hypothetical protein